MSATPDPNANSYGPPGAIQAVPLQCPHCLAPIAMADRAVMIRCETCRLIIGAGRTLTADAVGDSQRGGTAAGTISSQARRDAVHGAGDPAAVARDLQLVARELGVATARLRMLDYQSAWAVDQSLTSLGEIVGAYGSWKAARRAAAQDEASGPESLSSRQQTGK